MKLCSFFRAPPRYMTMTAAAQRSNTPHSRQRPPWMPGACPSDGLQTELSHAAPHSVAVPARRPESCRRPLTVTRVRSEDRLRTGQRLGMRAAPKDGIFPGQKDRVGSITVGVVLPPRSNTSPSHDVHREETDEASETDPCSPHTHGDHLVILAIALVFVLRPAVAPDVADVLRGRALEIVDSRGRSGPRSSSSRPASKTASSTRRRCYFD